MQFSRLGQHELMQHKISSYTCKTKTTVGDIITTTTWGKLHKCMRHYILCEKASCKCYINALKKINKKNNSREHDRKQFFFAFKPHSH